MENITINSSDNFGKKNDNFWLKYIISDVQIL